MGELTEHKGGQEIATTDQADSGAMLRMIADAASNPDVDATKMETLANLALKLKSHEQQEQFNKDKIAALMEMPSINQRGAIKNRNNQVQSRYSKFEDIHRVVKPILERHNLAISFNVGTGERGAITVQPILAHRNGHVEYGSEMTLQVDTSGSKNATQGAGSAASYGKRHALKAMLNIVEGGEDDDGQGGELQLDDSRAKLVADMEAAAKAGNYPAKFDALTPADKGWLVDHGHDARLRPQEQLTPQQQRKAWVDKYLLQVEGSQSMTDLLELQDKHRDTLDKFRDADQPQWERIKDAHDKARTRLDPPSE